MSCGKTPVTLPNDPDLLISHRGRRARARRGRSVRRHQPELQNDIFGVLSRPDSAVRVNIPCEFASKGRARLRPHHIPPRLFFLTVGAACVPSAGGHKRRREKKKAKNPFFFVRAARAFRARASAVSARSEGRETFPRNRGASASAGASGKSGRRRPERARACARARHSGGAARGAGRGRRLLPSDAARSTWRPSRRRTEAAARRSCCS